MTDRTGDFIQTFTGKRFYPLDPRPDEVHIEDIAHALSNICRFNGHVKRFYCPTPEQRVLTEDLQWRPAGDLKVGDKLIGFDEHPTEVGGGAKKRRRFRPATVTHAEAVRRPVIRLEMADGSTVRASAEHPWLVATKLSRNQQWKSSSEIAADIRAGKKRYMHKFSETWRTERSREAGWLAGIYDGEAHFSARNRGGVQLAVSQLPGAVLVEAERLLALMGFPFTNMPAGTGKVRALQSRGGWREAMRLLGSVRPLRLLENFSKALHRGDLAKQMDGAGTPLEIVCAYDEGEDWVAGLETSTHTYLCEGYAAHNSVAEHSVFVALCTPIEHRVAALLHDASEAYLCDLPRPVKLNVTGYHEAESRVMDVIAEKFGFSLPLAAPVKLNDNRILLTERETFMERTDDDWQLGVEPLLVQLRGWAPQDAEAAFLQVFYDLGERVRRV